MTHKSLILYNFLATTIDYTTFFINIDNILTPNQLDDISTCIQHAKEFLQENPNKLPITITCIYNLLPLTLYSFLKRPKNYKHSG
jgi:hypothetical protein